MGRIEVMKQQIQIFEYANHILKQLEKGVVLTTKANDTVNVMIISWGTLGIQWGKPVFITYVRENRYTKSLLDANGEFTVCIPMDTLDPKIFEIAGTKSGQTLNKIETLGLTLIEAEKVSVPAIKQLPITLECKVIYKQKQDKDAISKEFQERYYPEAVASDYFGANKDYHTLYYGEIVDAYIIKEEE